MTEAELSWWLLERKLMYYHPELIAPKYHKELICADAEYDKNESEYLKMTDKEALPVGIDLERPSVQLILKRVGRRHK